VFQPGLNVFARVVRMSSSVPVSAAPPRRDIGTSAHARIHIDVQTAGRWSAARRFVLAKILDRRGDLVSAMRRSRARHRRARPHASTMARRYRRSKSESPCASAAAQRPSCDLCVIAVEICIFARPKGAQERDGLVEPLAAILKFAPRFLYSGSFQATPMPTIMPPADMRQSSRLLRKEDRVAHRQNDD